MLPNYMDPKEGLACVAACSLNQWALDFDGNYLRTLESIRIAKSKGAKLRVGPELELCGYGCEDHFLENDTVDHCWESLAGLLESDVTQDILCDIGMPVLYKSVRYNCRVFILNKKILLIRPKLILVNNGMYRESRYFGQWNKGNIVEEFKLPAIITRLTQQEYTLIGIAVLQCKNTIIASESCEELWVPESPHIKQSLDGVEIFCNGSGSYYEKDKQERRLNLITEATSQNGGVYIYSNQRGCDGGTAYFDGSALISINGSIIAQGKQFGLESVEVIVATIDLQSVRSFRACGSSRSNMAARNLTVYHTVQADISVSPNQPWYDVPPFEKLIPTRHTMAKEVAIGPACWLWDFLRRSNSSGFFLPLSGGADSASVAAIVGMMCCLVMQYIQDGNEEVTKELEKIIGKSRTENNFPRDAESMCSEILHTCYMGTANSSSGTRLLAKRVADEIGAYHLTTRIDTIVEAFLGVFKLITNKIPAFLENGGSIAEDLALQNVQARTRMALSYLLACLLPWFRGKKGWLLVLGTGNADECLRGYLTKYDCSSGDINPIGSFSKNELKEFLDWASLTENLGFTTLKDVLRSPPTAELRPLKSNTEVAQTDETDMGLTYEELGIFGKLRSIQRYGPVSMFKSLVCQWKHKMRPLEIARKVRHFYQTYARNRHKMTTITPSYHATSCSPDDNRFDHRPFLYPFNFERQFSVIDKLCNVITEQCMDDL